MLTEQQIVKAWKLEKEGRTFRKIAEEIGLDPRTQHSQVVSALQYFIMGYEAAWRSMPSTAQERSRWSKWTICFALGALFNMAIAAIVFSI
jgi:uncharacterized membrane protein YjjP (DUF1212 family)